MHLREIGSILGRSLPECGEQPVAFIPECGVLPSLLEILNRLTRKHGKENRRDQI